ncbi:MAG: cytochrome oxidase small assembly protein [Glaciimonas sp.]|nr:cytochrome oxidase small assembly protein [Glaciimonas sp.]
MSMQKKPNNLRTALLLGTLALVFFIGIFVNRLWFS